MPTLTRTRSSRSRLESWRWESGTQLMPSFPIGGPPFPSAGSAFSSHSSLLPFTGTAPRWYLYFPHILSSAFGCPLTFDFLSQASIPFAVIGSNQLIEVKGKKIRGRLYPWGVVEVENPEHNDFLKLRTMLVWVSLVIIWKVKSYKI